MVDSLPAVGKDAGTASEKSASHYRLSLNLLPYLERLLILI